MKRKERREGRNGVSGRNGGVTEGTTGVKGTAARCRRLDEGMAARLEDDKVAPPFA